MDTGVQTSMGFKLRFIQDDSVDQTEVIIRAKSQDEEVQGILKALGKERDDLIVCETLTSRELVFHRDIILISKSGRRLSVTTMDSEYTLNEPLYKVEERLDPTWFMKISQSEIVNLRYVKGWNLTAGGTIRIELADGTFTTTSRRFAVKIRDTLRKGTQK